MIYFSIKEMERSATADRLHIDNSMPENIRANYVKFIDSILDKIRQMWGKHIQVTSGYRCPKLNTAVGGVANSQHQGLNDCCAADITAGSPKDNERLYNLIQTMVDGGIIVTDQVLNECRGNKSFQWIHISWCVDVDRNRKQFISVQAR